MAVTAMEKEQIKTEGKTGESRFAFFHVFLVMLFLVGGIAIHYLQSAHKLLGTYGLPLDDSWIYSVFIRNLANGEGFSFNPGEAINAATSPLWTLLLAAGYIVWPDPILLPALLNSVLIALTCGVVYLLATQIWKSSAVGWIAAIVFGTFPYVSWGTVSGMEVSLYAFLAALAVYLYLTCDSFASRRGYLATVVMALAALSRPELTLLFPLAMGDSILRHRLKSIKQSAFPRTIVVHCLLFCAILLPNIVFNYSVNGTPLPTTFYSKKAPSLLSNILAGGWKYAFMSLVMTPSLYLKQVVQVCTANSWPLTLFVAPGMALAWKACNGRGRYLALVMMAAPVLTGWFATSNSQPQLLWQTGRYSAYLLPLFSVLAVGGAYRLWKTTGKAARSTAVIAVFIFLVASCLSAQQSLNMYRISVKNINEMQVNIGSWIRENVPPEEAVACQDIGAIGFFSGHEVVDLCGLVTPEILPLWREPNHEAALADYLQTNGVRYLVLLTNMYPNLSRSPQLHPLFRVKLEDNLVCGGDEMVVYQADW